MTDTDTGRVPPGDGGASPASGEPGAGDPGSGDPGSGDLDPGARDPGALDPGDWRAALADDERSFAEQFASPADAVRTALELRRKLSTSVQLPGPDADPAKRLELFDRLGRPESPDGYSVEPPDGLPGWIAYDAEEVQGAQRSFLEAMHAAGATQDMVGAALGWYWNHVAEAETGRDGALAAEEAEADAHLRREWGRDFDRNMELADRAIGAFGGDELGDTLDRYGLSAHPALVRAFARIGRSMGEHDMIAGSPSETTREDLRRRAEALVAEDDYWTNETHQREMREIMLKLYGDREIGPGTE